MAVIVVTALIALVGMVSLSLRFRSLPKDRCYYRYYVSYPLPESPFMSILIDKR